jgi:hypothetical protein
VKSQGYEERIRAHVVLCWLALLTLGTFTTPRQDLPPDRQAHQTQRDLLVKRGIPHPKKIIEATLTTD